MSPKQDLRWIGETMFARLRAAFPTFAMHLEPDPPDVDMRMSIPAQPGLLFPIELILLEEFDELEIRAGESELGFVGCSMALVREHWFEGVGGLLSGTFRIRETRCGGRTIQSELQRPGPEGWETILMSGLIGDFRGRKKSTRVLQNRV
jgi:hypothetical protein